MIWRVNNLPIRLTPNTANKNETRTRPFEGASGVTHPLLFESVSQFQSQAYKEMLPFRRYLNKAITV